jgi:hypothetical protein
VRSLFNVVHLQSCAGDDAVSSCRSGFEPDVHPLFLDDELVDAAGVDGDRCAPKGPDRNSYSRARARSNRTGCGSGIGFIRWSGTKTCRPNLTSFPPGRALTVLAGSESAGTRLCRLPKDARNRGQGFRRPHDRTCARARRRFGRPIRRAGPGMQPIPSITPGGTQRPFPSHNNGRRAIPTAGRQSSLGSIA